MKLLFAIKALDNIQGGAERVLCTVASSLATMGHDVTIVTYDRKDSRPFYPVSSKVRLVPLSIGDAKRRAGFVETLRRGLALRRFAVKERPDALIGFMHSSFVPAAFAMIGTGIPVVGSEHIVPRYYQTRRLEFMLFTAAAFLMRKITVLSPKIAQSYPASIRRKMVPIANPVVVPAFSKTKDRHKIILSVGRLDPQKDQRTLIDAFALIAPRYPDWTLRIIGEGALRQQLQNRIDALGLTDRITLPGSTSEIGVEYDRASIFALPSLFESFGLATAEAMAHGLPVIGFADCEGTNEIVTDGHNGYLIGSGNRAESLASSLSDLIDNPEKRSVFGENGRQDIKKYDIENVARAWHGLLSYL